MANKKVPATSKFLSLILRHKPELIDLRLDKYGWTRVDELIEKSRANGKDLDHETLKDIVVTNEKQRFSFNGDKTKIRANQGHSIPIDLGLEPIEPPAILFHGTAEKYLADILQLGLQKKGRHHVHLSADIATALAVGKRHGKPVVLEISASEMFRQGFKFFVSENRVWLTEEVPRKFLKQKD